MRHKAMTNVSRVVHSQSDSHDEINGGHSVYGHSPEIDDTHHVNLKEKVRNNWLLLTQWRLKMANIMQITFSSFFF